MIAPKLSAFTLVRHGVEFEYPFEESLRSLLPIVDELVVNVGTGTDATLARVQALAERARAEFGIPVTVFESDWRLDDPERKRGGRILSEQTNLALDRCAHDWCLYLQADEVLHEADHARLLESLARAAADPRAEGLVFDYVHLYGSFDVEQVSRSAYRREVRVIRRSSGARSVGDAQSFRKADGSKPAVRAARARVFHYGWVRPPAAMRAKTYFMDQLYHGAPSAEQARTGTPHSGENHRYKRILGLRRFRGSHPAPMTERIAARNWDWDFEREPLAWSPGDAKKAALDAIERFTGRRLFEYRSYELLKDEP